MGKSLPVLVNILQGVTQSFRVWLTDGFSVVDVGGETQGLMTINVVARVAGRWELHLSGIDTCGRTAQTGLVRVVTVLP